MKSISIFGVTGSVGLSTGNIIEAHPAQFSVRTVTANTNVEKLAEMAVRLRARRAVIADDSKMEMLERLLAGSGVVIAGGREALLDAANEAVDLHVAAIVGMAGLEPLINALINARSVAIANKEPLVAAGALVMETARRNGCAILPVDSEHNAIFQVLENHNHHAIDRIILTASGGPFMDADFDKMAGATPQQALAHPNWSMGAKISIDSATMMNKALEIIEAHYLFSLPADKIEVLIHPQSIVHSMVQYRDGSTLAQMGAPDMRTPLSYCLGWPDRLESPGERLSFTSFAGLTFLPVDARRFPAIKLAYDCLRSGQAACIALNAANEVAVTAFLEGRIGFLEIVDSIQKMVERTKAQEFFSLDDILAFDMMIRGQMSDLISQPSIQKINA